MTTLITVFCIYFIYRLCNFDLFNFMIQISFRLFIAYTHCTLCTVFRAYRLGTYYICHGYNYYPRNYVPPTCTWYNRFEEFYHASLRACLTNKLGGIQSFYKPLPTNCACCKRSSLYFVYISFIDCATLTCLILWFR